MIDTGDAYCLKGPDIACCLICSIISTLLVSAELFWFRDLVSVEGPCEILLTGRYTITDQY